MTFQSTVYTRPAPGVAGDFSSDGPRFFYTAGPGGLVAGSAGVTVGRFAWASPHSLDFDGGPSTANSFGGGAVTGFVHRNQQALITTYLAESGMTIPQGFGVSLLTGGDIWIKNEGTTEAVPGQFAFAAYATGAASFMNTGTTPTVGGSGDASTIAAGTASVTGSISDNILTVTAVGTGTLMVGGTLSGTGVVTGTQIVERITGTTNVGTWRVNIGEQTATSTTISETYGLLTIGGTVVSGVAVGQSVGGSGVTAGTTVTTLGTGTGGAGTYIVSPTQVISSQAIYTGTNVQTKWFAISSGLPGEVVRCSSQPLG
jgi:hypothetical protein